MINETYKSMLSGKSVIRELNEYANDITRHPHLKPEDMFDYSLGNPSVPAPEAFNARIKALLDSGDPMLVHGYSPSLGIPAAREKIAASLNRRFGMRYTMDDIFMTSAGACFPAGNPARRRNSDLRAVLPGVSPLHGGRGADAARRARRHADLPNQFRCV